MSSRFELGSSQWTRLLFGLCVVFAAFQWSAVALESDRGQAGLAVCALVVGTTLVVERWVFGQRLRPSLRALGFCRPRVMGLVVACGICLLLLAVLLVFVRVTGAVVAFTPDALSLTPGLFAQAGIAEESLFRGYLFARLRRGRSFRRAAWLSMLPFVGVHLLLFFTMPWPIALAALLLAVVVSFPLAQLFELGGGTIWAPALLHAVIQGTVKVVVVSGSTTSLFPLVWMAASATIPMLALMVPRQSRRFTKPETRT